MVGVISADGCICFFISFLPQADGWRGWQPHVFCIGDSTGPAYLEATKQRITTTRATGMARTTTKTKASQEPRQIKQNKFHVRDQIDNA